MYFEQLKRGAAAMELRLSDTTIERLVAYLELLIKWNKAYNLTAIREPEKMISLHLLDSLASLPYITGQRVIDVGTGPGLPGMVLALCLPEKEFTLLDSNGKKTRFLMQVKMALDVANVTVANERVEQHPLQGYYDHVTSRAFASLEDMIRWCRPLPTEKGTFLAMKGVYPDAELAALPDDILVQQVDALQVPTIDAERHMVILARKDK